MDELDELHSQIQELQQRAERLAAEKKAEVVKKMRVDIQRYSITAKDLGLDNVSRAAVTIPVKYRLGDLTWTGRGRKPRFIEEHLASGGQLSDLAV